MGKVEQAIAALRLCEQLTEALVQARVSGDTAAMVRAVENLDEAEAELAAAESALEAV